jgi:cytochrome P450
MHIESLARTKTPRITNTSYAPIEKDAQGVWHVHGYDEAKTILRHAVTKQLGFKAELLGRMPSDSRLPILYQEGEAHLEQRKQTARFFTPKAVSSYRPVMEEVADRAIARMKKDKRADLRQLSLDMAMRVVAQVVGLTDSTIGGIENRLDVFLRDEDARSGNSALRTLRQLYNQLHVFLFFFLDVKPSIEARRRQPRDDLISYLLEQKYKDWEIFTECVTYGAAGMVTTREFIALAAWHLIEQPKMRERFLVGGEAERHAILHEVLRLEPIVAMLKRIAEKDIVVESGGRAFTIPKGEPIHIHVQRVNADETVVGENPGALCPMREMQKQVVMPSVMGFGDGHHRCPGAYVALHETDVLLQRLLKLDNLRIERAPDIFWSSTASGYTLRNFVIAI